MFYVQPNLSNQNYHFIHIENEIPNHIILFSIYEFSKHQISLEIFVSQAMEELNHYRYVWYFYETEKILTQTRNVTHCLDRNTVVKIKYGVN